MTRYDTVELVDVDAVLANYLRHRAEVEAHLAEQQREGAEMQPFIESVYPPDGLRAKILARLET
jgi:hypothetical protein